MHPAIKIEIHKCLFFADFKINLIDGHHDFTDDSFVFKTKYHLDNCLLLSVGFLLNNVKRITPFK